GKSAWSTWWPPRRASDTSTRITRACPSSPRPSTAPSTNAASSCPDSATPATGCSGCERAAGDPPDFSNCLFPPGRPQHVWTGREILKTALQFFAVCKFFLRIQAMSRENLLIVADSERDANMLYAVGLFVPDPFIYLRLHGQCHVVMSDLEIDRARQQAG